MLPNLQPQEFYLKTDDSQNFPKSCQRYLNYFWKKIWRKGLSKIAQSGHTGPSLGWTHNASNFPHSKNISAQSMYPLWNIVVVVVLLLLLLKTADWSIKRKHFLLLMTPIILFHPFCFHFGSAPMERDWINLNNFADIYFSSKHWRGRWAVWPDG